MLHLESANAAHAKNACYLCNNPNDIVDTEVNIDYEGVLVICKSCVRDMAHCAGYDLEHTVEQWETLERGWMEAVSQRESAEKALADIKDTTTAASRAHRERERRAGRV